jgi:hypothetical protein
MSDRDPLERNVQGRQPTSTLATRASASALVRDLEAGLYGRIAYLERAIRHAGFVMRVGCEDEFYIFGRHARSFLEEGSEALAELRATFPGVGRVYAERDSVSFRGCAVALGIPGVRKWEITTKHQSGDGHAVSAEHQARLVTDVRRFLTEITRRHDHHIHYGARPIKDLREIADRSCTLIDLDPNAILVSLKEQAASKHFLVTCQKCLNDEISVLVFEKISNLSPDTSSTTRRDVVRSLIRNGDGRALVRMVGPRMGANLLATLSRRRHSFWARTVETVIKIVRAKSLMALFEGAESALLPESAPGCGVDANVSLTCKGRNAFWSSEALGHTTPLLRAVAGELIRAVGRETGSLLPAVQSYNPDSFFRLFRADLHASSRAALGNKSSGACCKISPDSIDENPARAVEHDYDMCTEDSLRLEVRLGEPGGGLNKSNPLAHPHYMLLVAAATWNGLRRYRAQPNQKSDLLPLESQDFDRSYSEVLESFSHSRILKDSYGRRLHALTLRHARGTI